MTEGLSTDAERTKAQGARLRQLRERLGVSRARVMDAVGLTTTNGYDLYERGVSAIRLNQVAAFAAGLGISEQRFIDEVLHGGPATADDLAAFRRSLHALIPQSPAYAEDLFREHADDSAAGQQALLRFVTRLAREGLLVVPARFRAAPADRSHPPNRAEPSEAMLTA